MGLDTYHCLQVRRIILWAVNFISISETNSCLSVHFLYSYDSESTDTLLDAHQMNDGSITPNSVSTMGSDNYFMSAKQSDAPTPTPPGGGSGSGGGGTKSKERKKHDRFNGMSEEEVCKRTLPDHLDTNLDVVIVSTVDFHGSLHESVVVIAVADGWCTKPTFLTRIHGKSSALYICP